MQDIKGYLTERIANREKVLIRNFAYVGLQCVNQARSTDTYKDRSGNLRSSTGYTIIVNGKIEQQSSFEQVPPKAEKKPGDKYNGGKLGEQFSKKIAAKFPKGICLVVVAGMNYAYYVSARGFDVLDSAESLAERLVPQILKQLGFTVK